MNEDIFHMFSVTDSVDVTFGLRLLNILNVDEKAQIIKLKVLEEFVSNRPF